MSDTEQLTDEGPVYTRSTGAKVPLSSMPTPHLKSALAKLQRDFPSHPEIGPMADEAARRDEEFAAKQAAFEHNPVVADFEIGDPFS